jgi:hypothetical protein
MVEGKSFPMLEVRSTAAPTSALRRAARRSRTPAEQFH